MIPGAGGDPERGSCGDVEIVERVLRPTLADVEGDQRGDGDCRQPEHECSLVRDGREVDRQDQRRNQHDREDAAEVVDWIGRLVDVARDEEEGQHERHRGERQRQQEDRPPPEVLQEQAGEQRAERGDGAAEPRPERDRLRSPRPGPERGDQGERGRVGHACSEASQEAGDEEDFVARRPGGEAGRGDRERRAEEQHQLAPVAVAESAEVEHRRGETERVADCDQVERRLRGVERLADRGQGDVGDSQVQVGDRRDQDQRNEYETRTLRGCRSSSYLCHG